MPLSFTYSIAVLLAILVVIVGYLAEYYFCSYSIQHDNQPMHMKLQSKEAKLFQEFDKNQDLMLSVEEFVHLYKNIQLQGNSDQSLDIDLVEENYDLHSDEVVRLQADMTPLDLSTMSQTKKDIGFGSDNFIYPTEFDGLRGWKKVNIQKQELFAKEFMNFLPLDSKIEVGKPYWIMPKSEPNMNIDGDAYRPSKPTSKRENIMNKLFMMFHSRPFLHMRFSPDGGVAVVRAQNKVYFEIQFRIHCEFQLNEHPRLPFWFTPSQFSGSLIIARDGSHVRNFNMHVPNVTKLNVDMEWKVKDPGDSSSNVEDEVDIGFIPMMRLWQLAPSSPVLLKNIDGTTFDRRELWKNDQDIHMEFDSISWSEKIPVSVAKEEIDMVFYPFKKVKYFPFEEAFDRASLERKLVHQVVLWGALDDQSC